MGGTIGTPGGHERVLGLMCEVCECVVSVLSLYFARDKKGASGRVARAHTLRDAPTRDSLDRRLRARHATRAASCAASVAADTPPRRRPRSGSLRGAPRRVGRAVLRLAKSGPTTEPTRSARVHVCVVSVPVARSPPGGPRNSRVWRRWRGRRRRRSRAWRRLRGPPIEGNPATALGGVGHAGAPAGGRRAGGFAGALRAPAAASRRPPPTSSPSSPRACRRRPWPRRSRRRRRGSWRGRSCAWGGRGGP